MATVGFKGLKEHTALCEEIPPHSYGTTPVVRAHTVLPAMNTSEHAPPQPHLVKLVLDIPTPAGWKAELT